jgi:hypothetical protein
MSDLLEVVAERKIGEPRTALHLDLMPTVGTRDQEGERLVVSVHRWSPDEPKSDGTGLVTMVDPEGNQFRARARCRRARLACWQTAAELAHRRDSATPAVSYLSYGGKPWM